MRKTRPIIVTKRAEVDRRNEEARRTELAMLKIWVQRYPDKAEEFLRQARIPSNICCNETLNVVT